MGSGNSSSYSGTRGVSQPYAETYHVVPKELNKDKQNPDIYDPRHGYFKNPTATSLENAIQNDRIYIDGKKQGGVLTYVMDQQGTIIIGKRVNPNNSHGRAPHPTLIGGRDPQVQCAGMIEFKNGRISSVNTNSGHYRPNSASLPKVKSALQKLCNQRPDLFDRKSEWRNQQ